MNTIEYESFSGNLTIQLADHFFQFVILEGFFFDTQHNNHNIKERNFKDFNEREFNDILLNLNMDNILNLGDNDPNRSTKDLYDTVNYILDELAPYKELKKRKIQLKKKP